MDIRYTNLIQFISDIREEVELNHVMQALSQLSWRQIEHLQSELNVLGHPLQVLAREMLKEYQKKAK